MTLSLRPKIYTVTIYEYIHYSFIPVLRGNPHEYDETPMLLNEVHIWLSENTEEYATMGDISYDREPNLTKAELLFTNEADAMAFKLRWL